MAGRKLQKYLEPAAATFSATGPRYENIGRLQQRMLSGGGLHGSKENKPSKRIPQGMFYPLHPKGNVMSLMFYE